MVFWATIEEKGVVVKFFKKLDYMKVIGVSLIAVASLQYYNSLGSGVIVAVAANVEANIIELSSQTSGVVSSIYTSENSFISEGDGVASIDTSHLEARLLEAKVRGLSFLAKVNYADADIALIATQAESVESEFVAVSAILDNTKSAYDSAKADKGSDAFDYAAALEYEILSLERDIRALNDKSKELIAKQSKVEMSKGQAYADGLLVAAQVEMLLMESQKHHIDSPVTGVVSNVDVSVGQFVEVGDKIAQVVDLSDLWVTAYIGEKDIGKLKIGDRAQVRPKASETWLPAVIESISPSTVKRRHDWLPMDNVLIPVKLSVKMSVFLQSGFEVDVYLLPSMANEVSAQGANLVDI